jgi:hypothetical protein
MWQQFPAAKKRTYERVFHPRAADPVFKTLPAKILASVPRRELYASIDSLAVYQFLNRGTCRPIWRIKGPTEAAMPEEIARHRQESVRGTRDAETKFGTFVRLYFTAALRHTLSQNRLTVPPRLESQTTLASVFPKLSAKDRQMLVLSTLNPILVETAALYFCLDLGVMPTLVQERGSTSSMSVHEPNPRRQLIERQRGC